MTTPHDRSRRAVLSTVAAGLATVAGCAGDEVTPTGTPTASPTDVHTPTATHTASPSDTPTGTLTLEPIPAREADGTLLVYPPELRGWLRTAATTDQTIRANAETPTYDPSPPLAAFERIQFDDEAGELSGVYDLSVEGDTRYELLVGAEETDPPDNADVTPISSLPEKRRELALAAIGKSTGEDARVSPETELGSWVRHEFFGGYFSHDGTTYRGKEAQQTDAEFFATAVWYVLSATAVDASSPPVTLRLAGVADGVRRVLSELRAEESRPTSVSTTVTGEMATAVEAFAEENSLILTHDAVYRVSDEA
ncbi:MAG: hypothetical protein V5A38_06260 [Halolamina sp.]|uniref:hypothetical protein n=1 Tax=Halolamina sp. TaxID=1940283 RepID=UPI002FC3624E